MDVPGEKALAEVAKDRAKDIYEDGLKPAVREISKSLGTVFGLVNTLLYPLEELRKDSSYKHQHFMDEIKERAKAIPEDKLVTPPLHISGPAFEGLRYTMDVKELREMYIAYLLCAMNSDTQGDAHPSFAEVIRQLSPDEAKILKTMPPYGLYEPVLDVDVVIPGKSGSMTHYSNASVIGREAQCKNPKNTPMYIDNLCRLGLAAMPECSVVDEARYDKIYVSDEYMRIIEGVPKAYQIETNRKCFGLTGYGARFRKVCMGE